MDEQFVFGSNGYITPCPYADQCLNNPAGCDGERLWCGRDAEFFRKYGKLKGKFGGDSREHGIL